MQTRQRFIVAVGLVLLMCLVGYSLSRNFMRLRNLISYSTRPLWDSPLGPTNAIPHYYAEGMDFDRQLCALHGWDSRGPNVPEVWDAVLFSSELDLLEIRMHELDSVVSKFFIVESDRTFTGIPKPLIFHENRHRFSAFADKIVYSTFEARELRPDESPFVNEGEQRRFMDSLLHSQYESSRQHPYPRPLHGPLVLFSDVDEIPSAHTMKLLQHCKAPNPIHLQMKEYLYSFEWPAGEGSWRAQVHLWDEENTAGYGHTQVADVKLADSGWHCTFCFRHLKEFAVKMRGYSHADRVTDESLLDPEEIQDVICHGKDIFGMLPEAYRYKDLFALMNKDPTASAVHLPRYILQNSDKFRFLLPGGCIRSS